MTITSFTLIRAAAVAAMSAGLIFIGVQINHPHADLANATTTEWAVRGTLKLVMAMLAVAGITGMYLRQIRQSGLLGLLGWVVLAASYLLIFATTMVSAYVVPALVGAAPGYASDVLIAGTGGTPAGDLGPLGAVVKVQGFGYLAGGLVFGIALFRGRVLYRWAAVLLAVGGLVSAALTFMPDAFYRFLAYPNGIAMIALGYSLWRSARTFTTSSLVPADQPRTSTPAGAK